MEIWITIISAILNIGFIGNLLTLKSQRKKAEKDVQNDALNNVEKAVEFYQKQFDRLTAQVVDLQSKIDHLENRLKNCLNCPNYE